MIEWLANHQLPCIFKLVLGIECPTCGFQTAFIFLLKGNLHKSLLTFPALIPCILLFAVLIFYAFFKKPGWIWIKRLMMFDLCLIFMSYFVKMIL
jgi:hypothetical protein